ncbi:hypothetical protein [Aromatoleum sp.]|uniref:hypothetical protein n=1 Tax=Aromatoleum sp. TaxID=2307007 RepID=UPI002FC8386D
MDKGSIQFLLVAVPVLSLVGSWLALKAVGDRRARRSDERQVQDGAKDKAKDE